MHHKPSPAPAPESGQKQVQTLARALSQKPKSHSSPDHHRSRSFSGDLPTLKKKPTTTSNSLWKTLKSFSSLNRRRHDLRFTLHVHAISRLPSCFDGFSLRLQWRRLAGAPSPDASTRPARVSSGEAVFDEELHHLCSVYGARSGPHGAAKYESRLFVVSAAVVGVPEVELGKHQVDLTRFLPVRLEELEKDGCGWLKTRFGLEGKGKGAMVEVSFGYLVVGKGKGSGSLRRVGSVLDSGGCEDVRVLHEVVDEEVGDVVRPQLEAFRMEEVVVRVPDVKEMVVGDGRRGIGSTKDSAVDKVVVGGGEMKVGGGLEVVAVDRGTEVLVDGCDLAIGGKGIGQGKELLGADGGTPYDGLVLDEQIIDELDLAFGSVSVSESVDLESVVGRLETAENFDYFGTKASYKTRRTSRSLDFDDEDTESIANEFLKMVGLEHSPSFKVNSESGTESPRELVWQEFEVSKEVYDSSSESRWRQSEKDSWSNPEFEISEEYDWGDDLDLASMVDAAEAEHQKAGQDMKSKTRAKLLEDAETEALMREWGLNEKAFRSSPSGSRHGFGSPIDLGRGESLGLPSLGEGLGPYLRTKDGGFLRSMSPSLFRNCKNGHLVMQVSSPVVVPAEMGSEIKDILQQMASIGIEKLSMHASRLMPLEDITGKSMQQLASDTIPSLKANKRQETSLKSELGTEGNTLDGSEIGNDMPSSSSSSSETGKNRSELVSLEDLAPLAIDKIEVLAIEGLRIQSDTSNIYSPSNNRPKFIGNTSAFEGIAAKNGGSLGLKGTAGLQLLDVKHKGQDVDGIMGLSLTLDEWMRLDSGNVNEEDRNSDRTSKILAAHHATPADMISCGQKDRKEGQGSSKRWGLLGDNFIVALMVQLRDPMRNYEPVGNPFLSLVQVERVFIPPKPKIYRIYEKRNGKEDMYDEGDENMSKSEEKDNEEEEVTPLAQFKINEVQLAGIKSGPCKKKVWGNPTQQLSGSRWLVASGMGKNRKDPFLKIKSQSNPTVPKCDTLWSISSQMRKMKKW